jgi:hypothetical protein
MSCCKGWLVSGVVALFCLIWLSWSSCDKRPTEPEPPPPQPKDYPVYFYNNWDSIILVFHPLTHKIDSIYTPIEGVMRGLTVSGDGRLLYLSQGERVLLLTTDLRFIGELPYSAWWGTAVSPDDDLLAIMGDDFHILRTTDWSVVYSDTIRLHNGIFSGDSRTFYAGSVDGGEYYNYVFWLRPLDSNPVLNHYELAGSPGPVIPTPDNTRLLAYLLHRFVVYDICQDSVVHETAVWPGTGQLAMTPDGTYGFFSNPSTPLGELGTADVYAFDVQANRICDTFHIDDLLDSLQVITMGVGQMVVTPDGRWLVALDAPFGPHVLILYDLSRGEAVYLHDFGLNYDLGGISVQQMK